MTVDDAIEQFGMPPAQGKASPEQGMSGGRERMIGQVTRRQCFTALSVSLLGLILCACSMDSPKACETKGGLTLCIQLDKATYSVSEEADATVTIRNSSSGKKRVVKYRQGCLENDVRQAGYLFAHKCIYGGFRGTGDDTVSLEPGESYQYSKKVRIHEVLDGQPSGVEAHYHADCSFNALSGPNVKLKPVPKKLCEEIKSSRHSVEVTVKIVP